MKIIKISNLRVDLDKTECMALNEAVMVLKKIEETMKKYDCDTLKCCDEYTYDISDIMNIIGDLEMFEDITEIFR